MSASNAGSRKREEDAEHGKADEKAPEVAREAKVCSVTTAEESSQPRSKLIIDDVLCSALAWKMMQTRKKARSKAGSLLSHEYIHDTAPPSSIYPYMMAHATIEQLAYEHATDLRLSV